MNLKQLYTVRDGTWFCITLAKNEDDVYDFIKKEREPEKVYTVSPSNMNEINTFLQLDGRIIDIELPNVVSVSVELHDLRDENLGWSAGVRLQFLKYSAGFGNTPYEAIADLQKNITY
jgi:hypothetical protein